MAIHFQHTFDVLKSIYYFYRAKRARKVLGGSMRQAGIIAAAGVVALDTMSQQLQIDHEHTYNIAKGKIYLSAMIIINF